MLKSFFISERKLLNAVLRVKFKYMKDVSFKQTRLLSCIVFLYEHSMYPFHSSVTRRQRLTEGVSEAWCFKKLFELFDSIIIYGYVYSFWYKMMAL